MQNTKKADVCSSCPGHKWSSVLSSHWEYRTPPHCTNSWVSPAKGLLYRGGRCPRESLIHNPQSVCNGCEGRGRGRCVCECVCDNRVSEKYLQLRWGFFSDTPGLQILGTVAGRHLSDRILQREEFSWRGLSLVTGSLRTWLHAVHLWTVYVRSVAKGAPARFCSEGCRSSNKVGVLLSSVTTSMV